MLSPTNAGSGVFNDSSAAPSDVDALNNMLKSNALLNPALLSINPSLYAVQLAQLQAAQLLSQGGLQQLAAARRSIPLSPDRQIEYRKSPHLPHGGPWAPSGAPWGLM